MAQELLSRIIINPQICHGKPIIRGARYPVYAILEYLAGGDNIEDILQEFPDLHKKDVFACIAYACASMKLRDIKLSIK